MGGVDIRNESTEPVTVRVQWPSGLPLGLLGPSQLQRVVPPWQPGWCPAAGIGVMGLPVTITVSGSALAGDVTLTPESDEVARYSYYVRVDTSGQVVTGSPPPNAPSCAAYPMGNEP